MSFENSLSRRKFIKATSVASLGLIGALHSNQNLFAYTNISDHQQDLYQLSEALTLKWGEALLKLQITDQSSQDYGGILCPYKKIVHGRVGDTIYPFFQLAKRTGNAKYIDAARLLYRWMEAHVSMPDGSWLNEQEKGSWKGTTVFTIIALCETLRYHGDIMDSGFKSAMLTRLQSAGNYVYDNFSMMYGNINYPIAASYALALLGDIIDEQKFSSRARDFAYDALKYITKEKFIYGEGDQLPSEKGCFAIDLGYNVEESLPSLVLYGLLKKDDALLQQIIPALQAHMEFMLPDGGWDDSWGTRNYKWTYWGSRTSDGCQPAYALMAKYDPKFYTVALLNTRLLERCTYDGLLQGGLHNHQHKIIPSVHHTFCHIKSLATILDHKDHHHVPRIKKEALLPRAVRSETRFFSDIQTWLISKGKFRATVTAYDKDYKNTTRGHASGGALTMLWHEDIGVILAASMNEYQLIEAGNMQSADDSGFTLTPRIELVEDGITYTNINDHHAAVQFEREGEVEIFKTASKLVDGDQKDPLAGAVHCNVIYKFAEEGVIISFHHEGSRNNGAIKIIAPVVSASDEAFQWINNDLRITRKSNVLDVLSNGKLKLLTELPGARVFNFVPGLEAIPLGTSENDVTVSLKISR